jgi:hypothetical protein
MLSLLLMPGIAGCKANEPPEVRNVVLGELSSTNLAGSIPITGCIVGTDTLYFLTSIQPYGDSLALWVVQENKAPYQKYSTRHFSNKGLLISYAYDGSKDICLFMESPELKWKLFSFNGKWQVIIDSLKGLPSVLQDQYDHTNVFVLQADYSGESAIGPLIPINTTDKISVPTLEGERVLQYGLAGNTLYLISHNESKWKKGLDEFSCYESDITTGRVKKIILLDERLTTNKSILSSRDTWIVVANGWALIGVKDYGFLLNTREWKIQQQYRIRGLVPFGSRNIGTSDGRPLFINAEGMLSTIVLDKGTGK